MKYYIVAGEASGDLHGSNLIKGLKQADPEADFRVWGGDLMQAAGGTLVKHYKDTAIIGFWEVVKKLGTISKNINLCKSDILTYQPDVVILIDYPGFNFRIAEFAHEKGLKVFYYIAPKVWAWKESRVKKLRKYVDKLFIIFNFEVEYFKKHGIDAFYGGNPLIDSIQQFRANAVSFEEFVAKNGLDQRPIIAMLAGSRTQEVHYILPRITGLAELYPDYQFVVAGTSWFDPELYEQYLKDTPIKIVYNQTYDLFAHSVAGVIKSGTASLEAAIFEVPQIVCYYGSQLSWMIADKLVKVEYASLVNLILGRESVKELIQKEMAFNKLNAEFKKILPGGENHAQIMADYDELNKALGGEGASQRVSTEMVRLLKEYKK